MTVAIEGGFENNNSNLMNDRWDNSYVMLRIGAAKEFFFNE